MRLAAGAVVGLILAVAMPFAADAAVVDLATSLNGVNPVNGSGVINGAIFEWTDFNSTGTGVIDTFVQLQSRVVEHGYNTTENNTLDNGSSDVFNHEIALSSIPLVNINGVNYREFLLDINEPGSGLSPLLTLNEVQIIQSNVANSDSEAFSGGILQIPGGSLRYRMDAGGDNTVLLNAALNNGSGSGDMFMYIPDSVFSSNFSYVYLYSCFGNIITPAQAGFEEWAVRLTPESNDVVPEPASLSLIGLGLAGMAVRKLRKRNA